MNATASEDTFDWTCEDCAWCAVTLFFLWPFAAYYLLSSWWSDRKILRETEDNFRALGLPETEVQRIMTAIRENHPYWDEEE